MKKIAFLILAAFPALVPAQRTYRSNSVLGSGTWYKISVKDAGVYKIDIAFLSGLGINTSSLNSASIRLFGNGGDMLPEANATPRPDDLEEKAIMVVDGGDGVLNGGDYLLFFSNGADVWLKDSVNKRFTHKKNLYSDKAYYYLSVGGTGKRIPIGQNNLVANVSVTSFDDRLFHELDTINFLSSGKEWFGEEFSNTPGHSLTRDFSFNIPNLDISSPVTISTDCLARSISVASRFDVSCNSQLVQQVTIPPVTGGQYDRLAEERQSITIANVSQPNVTLSYRYVPGSFNSQGWLNWFEIFVRRNLSLNGSDQVMFRDWNSVGNNIGEYVVSGSNSTTQVWDVTDPLNPVQMRTNLQGSDCKFVNGCSRLREYIAFNSSNLLQPTSIGRISNQDLHASPSTDLIIITAPSLLPQAQRLAEFDRRETIFDIRSQ